jgi:hypothetical protein
VTHQCTLPAYRLSGHSRGVGGRGYRQQLL